MKVDADVVFLADDGLQLSKLLNGILDERLALYDPRRPLARHARLERSKSLLERGPDGFRCPCIGHTPECGRAWGHRATHRPGPRALCL